MTTRNSTSISTHNQTKSGDIFHTNQGGSVTVVDFINSRNVIVRHNDTQGHISKVNYHDLKLGKVKNPYLPSVHGIGFIGYGDFRASVNGVKTTEYQTWKNMITRCYCAKSQERVDTYIGCKVHHTWHNFQTFAEWLTSSEFFGRGYELDKDILVRGSRIYSPETCSLIPQELNTLLCESTKSRGKYPTGTGFHKASGKYRAYLAINSHTEHLGLFNCLSDARKAYKTEKESYVKRKAEEWFGLVDNRVINSLRNWTVI